MHNVYYSKRCLKGRERREIINKTLHPTDMFIMFIYECQ